MFYTIKLLSYPFKIIQFSIYFIKIIVKLKKKRYYTMIKIIYFIIYVMLSFYNIILNNWMACGRKVLNTLVK